MFCCFFKHKFRSEELVGKKNEMPLHIYNYKNNLYTTSFEILFMLKIKSDQLNIILKEFKKKISILANVHTLYYWRMHTLFSTTFGIGSQFILNVLKWSDRTCVVQHDPLFLGMRIPRDGMSSEHGIVMERTAIVWYSYCIIFSYILRILIRKFERVCGPLVRVIKFHKKTFL